MPNRTMSRISPAVSNKEVVPYIQSGDRALSSIYSAAFVGSALLVFLIFEAFIRRCTKGRA